MQHEIAIIGAGPAGMAATMQLMRYGINPLVIEQAEPGGLLDNAGRIENYPGFPNGIKGPALGKLFQQQFYSYQPDLVRGKVQKLDFDREQDQFLIETDQANYQPRLVVVASGTRAKRPPELNSLTDGLRKYIFYEIKELLQKENKNIIILGGGDIALDYALNLSQYHQVVLLCRSPHFRALPLLQERVRLQTGIRSLTNARFEQVEQGWKRALCVHIKNNGKPIKLEADCMVCAVGREADKSFYTPRLLEQESDLIGQTRLFLAGDVRNGQYRQIAIAVGDGLTTAMRIAEIQKVNNNESNR
jgi:thioredoxin reductase